MQNCVQAAQAAYDAITRQDPNLHQVIVNLESLQEDGKNLAAYSEQAKKTAEATEQQLQAEMNGLSAEKQQIEANIMKLRQDQANAERTLAQQEATLNSDVASIQTMERELVDAEGRLHRARKKKEEEERAKKIGGNCWCGLWWFRWWDTWKCIRCKCSWTCTQRSNRKGKSRDSSSKS